MEAKVRLIVRIVLSTVFLWAAVSKLWPAAPGAPSSVLGDLEREFSMPYALLPALELSLAAWIASGYAPRAGALIMTAALSAFTGLMLTELMRVRPRDCGCFGATIKAPTHAQLALGVCRNIAFITGAMWLAWRGAGVAALPAKGCPGKRIPQLHTLRACNADPNDLLRAERG